MEPSDRDSVPAIRCRGACGCSPGFAAWELAEACVLALQACPVCKCIDETVITAIRYRFAAITAGTQ